MTDVEVAQMLLYIIYVLVIFTGVGIAHKRKQMFGYWVGFIIAIISQVILDIVNLVAML